MYDEARGLAAGLLHSRLVEPGPDGHRFVGIYSKNCEEWVLTDLACVIGGFASLCYYDTLGKPSTEFITHQSQVQTIVCSASKLRARMQHHVNQEMMRSVKHYVIIGALSEEERANAVTAGLVVHLFREVIEIGVEQLRLGKK